ncbi:MAG: glycosyltransferase family 39 protein [Armatimonadetes bacterium]|nr:glycosyltransferase family 39 protein [Armatimonadota bacterium]
MTASSRQQRVLVLLTAAATVAFGLALTLGWEPGVRGEWVWRRNRLPVNMAASVVASIWLAALATFVCRAGFWERLRPRARALFLAALVLSAFILQLALLNALGIPWVTPGAYLASPNATTYFGIASTIDDPAQWIRQYPDIMRILPYHAATHPPGLVLFFLGVQRGCAALLHEPSPWLADVAGSYNDTFGLSLRPTEAAAAIASAVLIALLGSLAVVPLYLLARRLADPAAAVCATCLAAAMPGLLLLGASPDLILFGLAVTTLCLGYRAWQRHSLVLAALAGLSFALGLFLSTGFALVAGWALLWAIFGAWRSDDRPRAIQRLVLPVLGALAGLVAWYVALYLVFGYRPIQVALEGLAVHRGITTVETARTYWKWALMNPVECAIFAGLPLMSAAVLSARGTAKQDHPRLRGFLLSWLVLFAALNLSGAVRGEVGRIWLFAYWPLALAAGTTLSGMGSARGRTVGVLILLQTVQVLMMKAYLTIYSIL